MKLVEISWLDHWGSAGWKDVKDLNCIGITCKTVGYLVKENKDGYVIAATVAADGAVGGVSFRARPLVTRVRVLK